MKTFFEDLFGLIIVLIGWLWVSLMNGIVSIFEWNERTLDRYEKQKQEEQAATAMSIMPSPFDMTGNGIEGVIAQINDGVRCFYCRGMIPIGQRGVFKFKDYNMCSSRCSQIIQDQQERGIDLTQKIRCTCQRGQGGG